MNEEPQKPVVIEYRRHIRGAQLDRWPLALALILILGSLGGVMLGMAFVFTGQLGTLLAVAGGIFVLLAIMICIIERNW